MPEPRSALVLLAAATGLFLAASPPPAVAAEDALLCPFMQQPEQMPTTADLQRLLPKGNALDDPAELKRVVDELRRDGAKPALVLDHLIAAYCPSVASNTSLALPERRRRVRAFAARAAAQVYGFAEDGAQTIELTLPTATLTAARARAEAGKVSLEDWIAEAVGKAAGAK